MRLARLCSYLQGCDFEAVSDLVVMKTLPKVVLTTKAYQGSGPKSSVSEGELLGIRANSGEWVGLNMVSGSKVCPGAFRVKHGQKCFIAFSLALVYYGKSFNGESLKATIQPKNLAVKILCLVKL